MDITIKYEVCKELLTEIRTQLGDGYEDRCVVFTPVPVISFDFNDDLGCDTSAQLQVGRYGNYITSAVKQKRIILTKLIEKYGSDKLSSVICQGNYIRPTEVQDWTHLPYLTQYDWEATIASDDRTVDTLVRYVDKIWTSVDNVYRKYNDTEPSTLQYITAEELCKMYPDKIPDDRVKQYMKDNDYTALFVIGIGAELSDGKPHDHRAKDYDDYSTVTEYCGKTVTGLNGDLFVRFGESKQKVIELMSCGIRVDATALKRQLGTLKTEYHKKIAENEYVLTVGGGLGQERTLMYIFDLEDVRDTYPTLS